MNDFIRISIYAIGSIVFGPLLAIILTFYTDFYTISKSYKPLEIITDEWSLVLHFGLFWIGFYCMLSLWVEYKKIKNKPPKLDWWQTEMIYQIYVRSFHDANNDGCGDLAGIIKKLDYIKSLGTNVIWITPMYPSGGKDGGYDITSFTEIDPALGTMTDFESLVNEVHKRGMYILLDFIPNHTSNLHKWFKESSKNNDASNPYRDYYVWYPSEDKVNPPNNWVSCFGGPAWTYCETRKAWYLHQFLKEQPDLNYRCPAVRKEIEKTMRFWLEEKNVDGFRIDAFKHLFEDKNFEDEPVNKKSKGKVLEYSDFKHTKTADQPETFEILTEWRSLFDKIGHETNRTRALIVECTSDLEDIRSYYYYKNKPSANFALNFQLVSLNKEVDLNDNEVDNSFKPKNVKKLIGEYKKNMGKRCWQNWELGNHDNKRVATRIGEENVDLANAINLLIGGTAVVYNGEEIGMIDLPRECLKFEDCQDESGKKYGPKEYLERTRDFSRTPMQWNGNKNSGFSTSDKTWLPVNPNYKFLNVEAQLKNEQSHLKVFKDLANLRRSPSFQWGTYQTIVVNDKIFSFLRRAYGFPPFLVIMNLSNSSTQANLLINTDVAPRGYVVYYCKGSNGQNDHELDYKAKMPVLTKSVKLNPHDFLILTWAASE